MADDDGGTPTGVLPQIPGKLGVWLAVAAVAFPLATAGAGAAASYFRSNLDRDLERQKAEASQRLEQQKADAARSEQEYKDKLAVYQMFFDRYEKAKPEEQERTLKVIFTLYPKEFAGVSKLFVSAAATPAVKENAQIVAGAAVQAAAPVAQITTVQQFERQAFDLLAAGNLPGSRQAFLDAYAKYPEWHNVDELAHVVLTPERVSQYQAASPDQRKTLLAGIAKEVLDTYSWGMPASAGTTLRKLATS